VSRKNILSSIIAAVPLSYILGTFILNLNILLIILSGILLFIQGNRFKIINVDKLIFIFFLYIIFTGTWNTIESYYQQSVIHFGSVKNYDFSIIIKTLLFLRYMLLYFTIRLLIDKNLINYKIIFYSFSILSLFVSFDIIFQFYYGKDIFGFESPHPYKTTGPFLSEPIAGGFIQKFSFFLFFAFLLYSKMKNIRSKISVLTFLFFLTFFSILLSGNRMPLLLFTLGTFFVFINNKTLRKYTVHIALFVFLTSAITINTNPSIKLFYNSFYKQSKNIVSLYSYRLFNVGNDLEFKDRPTYIHEFDSGIGTFKMNKYLGGGLKSFRYNCPKREIKNRMKERTTCNMHPHNYYLEILTDLGLAGFLLYIILVIQSIRLSYKKINTGKIKYIISPFFYIFLIEVFPIRSSGSFFTTNNAVIIFLFLATIIGLSLKNKIES